MPFQGFQSIQLSASLTSYSLAEQLYEGSTHFLLELIQNADDNLYDVPTPTLNLIYENDGLRLDCNENGFTAKNVEALCAIGRSTKAGLNDSTRYISEKGIGFKSVFKAADVIWISSGDYAFKFDKREPLGMITPIWTQFPKDTIPGCTSFYIQFSAGYNRQELIHDIRSLDPRMLISLRRLRKLNLKVIQDGKTWETKFSRTDTVTNERLVVVLSQDDTYLQYLVRKHAVDGLPREEKRPECSRSEILLAFPLTDPTQPPKLSSQNVYAFLPIRDYGFMVSNPFCNRGALILTLI